jgi:hypothetical protein
MKTHVFNYTSDWLQRAESAGEQNSMKSHDTVSSSVQSSHCQGLVIRVFRNFKFVFLFQLTFTGTDAKKQPTYSTPSLCTNMH